jgi:hypothetical protein
VEVSRDFSCGPSTAAITVSQTVEARLRRRDPSTSPADAAGKVLGVKPVGSDEQMRFSNAVHWAYGTSWGVVRAALNPLGRPMATIGHMAAVGG